MKRLIYILSVFMAAILAFTACSTTSNLPEDEILYTGIKDITINGKQNTDAEKTTLTEVEAAIAYAPNNSLMGSSSVRTPFPIGLWIYNGLVNKQNSGISRWVFNTFGSTPKTISAVNPTTRTQIATYLLQNYGYFQGNVDYTLINQKNPKKQKISYEIHLGAAYMFDSIRYSFPEIEDSIIRATESARYIKQDEQFNVANLQMEKTRLAKAFRNNGFYYYRPDYISYFADSMQIPHRVKLLVVPDNAMPERAKRQWKIGNISTYIRNSNSMRNQYTDSLNLNGLKIAYSGTQIPVKPRVMFCTFRFWKNQLFNQEKLDNTITNLNNMQVFSQVQFSYTPRDTTDTCDILDVRLDATMDKLIDAEIDFNITQKSNSQIGPNLGLTFSKRNAFRHGETLSFKLKGSYEWQTNKSVTGESSKIDSYETGIEASLTYPWTAFPGLATKIFRYPTSSAFKLSVDHLNRAGYYRLLSFGAEAAYKFQTSASVSHTFIPITLTYNKLMETTAKFDSITTSNQALYISLKNQFIPAMQYMLTYDSSAKSKQRRTTWLELTVKESGNLISGIMSASGQKFNKEDKKLFGSPYSQFVKLTLDLRNKFKLTEKSLIATRFYTGAIFTYGNSSVAPYSELFYVGGANSIRAFSVRSIGPGSYYDYSGRGTYLDQAGDFKLEANIEYRFNITGNLYGATFIDAGNVWLLKNDNSHPNGKLGDEGFFKSLALGTGLGLRYDLEFLVLRLDLGIGIHAPYNTGKSGYYNIPKFKDSLGLHFAVGYPF
ncbi:MAG: BamA/TamA family outer membrane protein [Bacteroides sp.]|nr:BamA/TamA family outer membrane protein [Roseburia sp.]MCM1345679.1 BamA/TamA family outer membrane protein [Bacteroides sp.]MCM1420438.1 BamA/TamA family outer membrane protein [Bacteroides sp.]